MKMRSWNKMPVAALAALGLPVVMVIYAGLAQAVDTNAAAPTGRIAPDQVNLPPVPAEALRMSEAGMSDDVIISYIQKSPNSYTLDAEQIIYLHDLGVSSAVLSALVENGGLAGSGEPKEAASGTADTENVSSSEAPPVSGAAADFYNSLAPYGTWVDVPTYGWCWQPTVVVVDPAWQPYCNNGNWLWTDQGWYWNSYYSWGWAPFHYGRWCQYPGYGWLWYPDNTWGPAWVCWRDYPGYCGWAPLPPGACFTAGVGWTFNGLAVGFNYGFGLGSRCFTFCDYDHFCSRHSFEHFWHGRDADRFFHDSRVNNDFALDADHRFINRGIAPSRIEAVTHRQIQEVAVREWTHQPGRSGDFARPDRLTRSGNAQVIYRPGRDISVIRNHFPKERHTQATRRWGNDTATHGFAARHEVGNTPGFQSDRQKELQHSTPVVSWNHSYQNTFNQHWGGIGNSQVNHSTPVPTNRRDYSDSRRFTPNYHSTPAWHPVQAWHSAPAWHSTPAWHSAPTRQPAPAWHSAPSHSWGGETHTGGGTHFSGGLARFGGAMVSGQSFHR